MQPPHPFRPSIYSRALLTLAPLLCPCIDVLAQSTESNEGQLEEIQVTAERRVGTVQSTPLSITAISGAQLEAEGISNVADVAYETPGVSVKNSGPGQTEYEMRGISSSGGTSPTVGFYLDDVSLTPAAQGLEGKVVIDPSLYDLNRIEVLRGPQGTLYGSGSMGGTIRLITNQADPRGFAASGQVTGSGTDGGGANWSANVMVNFPIVDNQLALRLIGTDTYTSGWIDRKVVSPFPLPAAGGFARGDVLGAPVVADHTNVNWERLEGVRAAIQWQPLDELSVAPTALYQKITQGGPNFVDIPPGVDYEAHYQPFDIAEPYSDGFQLYTLPIKYDFAGIEINSISAYYDRASHLNQDSSEIGQDFMTALIGIPGVSYLDAGALTAYERDHTSQFSQEVRLSSNNSSPLQWVLGGYYQDYNAHTDIGTTTPGPIVDEIFGAPSYFYLTFMNALKQYAAFGEASYQWGFLRATAGLRYYSYRQSEFELEGGGLITGPAAPNVFTIPSSASGINPKFNLAYEPTKDLTLYVQAAKGFRPGGVNTPPPITCPKNGLNYGPDGIWSYEAGEKARFLDNRLIINAAGYFEAWSRIQQLFTETCGDTVTANAGTAHVAGGEIEASFRLTDNLTVSTSGGYTHARLTAVPAGSAFAVGDKVQNVPDYTNTTSVAYAQPLNDAYDVVIRATNVYTGSSVDTAFEPVRLPARNIANLRAGLQAKSNWSVFLFVDNLTNKRAYLADPEEIFTFIPSFDRATTNQPRTIGVTVSYGVGGKL